MKVIELKKGILNQLDDEVSLCIGFFDGVHKGHQSLINHAKSFGIPVAILMFEDEFRIKMRKETKLLSSFEDRKIMLEQLNVDYLIYLPFDEEILKMSPLDFINNYLAKLSIKNIVVGSDFRFGYKASGDALFLKNNITCNVEIMSLLVDNQLKISSTEIKKMIENGEIKKANDSLGHLFSLSGAVVEGLKNGRKLGFKTANMEINMNQILPKCGVYSAYCHLDKQKYLAMVNIGMHPTISKLDEPSVEVHIIGFNDNIYGKKLTIEFVDFLRDEKTFASLDELINQLKYDLNYVICHYHL